ncbi:MAG: COX15/CtaA family protein [Chloroflexi bacterium]|nr:COX15/CtaA family protein [Chloroflexota bacterium]
MKTETNVAEGASSPNGYRWLAVATCAATFALIVLGGVVRATGSGDACPDWPRCQGELIPPLEPDILIEFSHRLLASVVGLLVLAMAVVAWRSQRQAPVILWGATAALALVAGQIVLGGLTVLNDLPANMVMAHMALAATLLATLLLIAVASFDIEPAPSAERRRSAASFRNLAIFAALATFGLMLTGSFVSGSGAGLAFRDWPLFNGQLMPEGGRLAMIHAGHRMAAVGVGLLLVYVSVRAKREQHWNRAVLMTVRFAMALYGVQVLVGAANIWTLLQPSATATHLALAMAIWGALVTASLLAHRATQPLPQTEDERAGRALPRQGTVEPASATLPAGGAS